MMQERCHLCLTLPILSPAGCLHQYFPTVTRISLAPRWPASPARPSISDIQIWNWSLVCLASFLLNSFNSDYLSFRVIFSWRPEQCSVSSPLPHHVLSSRSVTFFQINSGGAGVKMIMLNVYLFSVLFFNFLDNFYRPILTYNHSLTQAATRSTMPA